MKKGILITVAGMIISGILYFGTESFDFAEGVKNDIESPVQENIGLAEKESKLEFSDDDCVFDLNTQNDDFLKGIPEFSNYSWDSEQKKATIKLDSKTTLIATRGGCTHFSFYGNLIQHNSELHLDDERKIFEKAVWIAEKLFHKSDSDFIKSLLNKRNFTLDESAHQKNYIFQTDRYCEMTLVVETLKDGQLSIEMGYYMC